MQLHMRTHSFVISMTHQSLVFTLSIKFLMKGLLLLDSLLLFISSLLIIFKILLFIKYSLTASSFQHPFVGLLNVCMCHFLLFLHKLSSLFPLPFLVGIILRQCSLWSCIHVMNLSGPYEVSPVSSQLF